MAKKRRKRKRFGRTIADACERLGVSHSELARRLGISQSRVPEIVRSESITEALLERCAKALGLEIEVRLVRRQKVGQRGKN